ncbi:MAG: DUF421 domain-containing protein [Turicibacter sp.]|nr:DUF421 domain-containing protein [Turicibacter sp.]
MIKILASILLAGVFYVVLLTCYKIMGKREVNQLSTVDIVINILIANVAAGGIVEEEYWLDALGGVIMLVLLQILMAKFQIIHPKGRAIVEGEPSLIIKNGTIDHDELKKIRIDFDDLMMLLRGNNVVTPEDVQYGIIEKNGKLTVYEKKLPTKTFPLPLVISGQIKPKALDGLGKNEEWLMNSLEASKFYKLEQIDYLFYEEHKLIIYTKQGIQHIKLK